MRPTALNFLRFVIAAVGCAGLGASLALAQPAQLRVKPTADGYEIAGKGFGKDKAKVQVFEGMTPVPAASIVSVTDDLIVVRSKVSGMIQHRVVIGNQTASVNFTHPATQPATKPVTAADATAKPGIGQSMSPAATGLSAAAAVAAVQRALPSLTQTVATAPLSLTGNRGQAAAALPPPLPSLTQTVTTAPVSLTGNRGQAATAPPPPLPSLTQTITTSPVSLTGNR